MKGKVNADREAVIRLQIIGTEKSRRTVKAVIDTGYTGALTLPSAVIRSMRMRLLGRRMAELADGSIVTFNFFLGNILWNGKPLTVEVDESQSDPLIGMNLLEGSELKVQVKRNGIVSIRTLP